MTRSGDVDDVEVVLADQPVEVRVDQVEARRRAPMTEETGLHVLRAERFGQQGVVEQVDLPDREVVGRPPPGVDACHLVDRERAGLSGRHRWLQIVRALRSQRRYARSGTGQTSPTRATASSSRRTTVTVVERDKKREARPGDPRARARQKAPTGALCLRFSVQAGRGVPTPGLSAPGSKP